MLTQESQRSGVARKAEGHSLAVSGGRQYSGRQALREWRHVDYGSGHRVERPLPQSKAKQAKRKQGRQANCKSKSDREEKKEDQDKKTTPS